MEDLLVASQDRHVMGGVIKPGKSERVRSDHVLCCRFGLAVSRGKLATISVAQWKHEHVCPYNVSDLIIDLFDICDCYGPYFLRRTRSKAGREII